MDDARRAAAESTPGAPGAEQQATGQGARHTSRHHRSQNSRTHRRQSGSAQVTPQVARRRRLRRALLATLVALCLATGLFCTLLLRTLRQLATARQELTGQVQAERRKVEQGAAEVARREAQLGDLVKGRLPKPLLPLVPDQLIPLETGPLRSILFTQVGTPERPGYEYKLTCKNDGSTRYRPRLRILLFNDIGIQTGSADLSDSSIATRLEAAGMAPGESASFSGSITLEFDDVPKYFILLSLDPGGALPRLSR